MALTALRWQKTGPRRHIIGFDDDLAGTHEFRVEVPLTLPEEFSTNGEYIYDAVKSEILIRRRRAQRRLDRAAEEANWVDATDEDGAVVAQALLDLQTELDA